MYKRQVSACRSLPQSKIRQEHVVVFENISDRDAYKAHGPKLQPYSQREAGIRLALPDHLLSVFKLLEHEGYKIAQRRPGTKRSIKYHDISQSLVMDVKLPDAAWVRIAPDQIAVASRGRRSVRVPAVSEILGIAAEELPQLPRVVEEDEEMEQNEQDQHQE